MLRRNRGLREVEENNLEIKRETVRQAKGSKLLLLMSKQIRLSIRQSRNFRLLPATAVSTVLHRHPPHTAHSHKAPLPTTRQLTTCHLSALRSPAPELLLRLLNKANGPSYKSLRILKVEALDNVNTDCSSRRLAENWPVC